MKTLLEIVKFLIQAVNFCILFFAVCFLFGEEAPDAHLSVIEFLGVKAGAVITLYLLYREFLFLGKHDLLPSIMKNSYKELIAPESDADRA